MSRAGSLESKCSPFAVSAEFAPVLVVTMMIERIVISEAEARQFFRAVESAVSASDPAGLQTLRVVGRANPGLAVSFDGRWNPFLGHTIGYNNAGKPARLPITEPSSVLTRAGRWLEDLGRPEAGGRVFLTATGVASDHQTIGQWQWPGEDPVRAVASMVYSARHRLK